MHGFKWRRDWSMFNKECKENYHEESDKGYILEVNVKYSKELHNLHSALAF